MDVFKWEWYFAGTDENPYAIYGKPDLLRGMDADGNIIRVCDYTHTRNFAIVKYNDERPGRVETDIESTEGLTALEYFVDAAIHGRAHITSQAKSVFTRFWDNTLPFEPLITDHREKDDNL